MKFSIAAVALSLASAAVANPASAPSYGGCLSQSQANTIVAEYAAIQAQVSSDLGTAKQTAKKLLAPGYQETSDSLNELIGLPLGSVTFQGKKAYIKAVLSTPAATLDTIKILVSGCNYITWYWQDTTVGSNPVKGFHLFETNSNGQLTQAWLEFNSIAWNEDLGGTCTIPAKESNSAIPGRI